MSEEFVLPAKLPQYFRRLVAEYERTGETALMQLLDGSSFRVDVGAQHDNWNGGIDGHDVVLLMPQHLMRLVPLDRQEEIQNKLREDLNKANSLDDEFVSKVRIEYLDDEAARTSTVADVSVSKKVVGKMPSFWEPNMIRLFISHRDSAKDLAHNLAQQMTRLGVKSFVAHDTIEPGEDWQHEIETALQTMDVMLALLTDGFFESAWTNQEIGYALGKGVPVISLKTDSVDPAGFIRKRQAIKGRRDQLSACAESVFDTIAKRLDGRPILRQALIRRLTGAHSFDQAGKYFASVKAMENFSEAELDELVTGFNENYQLNGSRALGREDRFLDFVNERSARTFYASTDGSIRVGQNDLKQARFR